MGGAAFEALHDVTVRAFRGEVSQTGFWIENGVIVTCAHGFADRTEGDEMDVEWRGRTMTAVVDDVDRETDVMLLRSEPVAGLACLPLGLDVEPPDPLYVWGYTATMPRGESLTAEMEGWSRAPFLLKLKQGLVDHGMSGAPVYSLRTGAIVGMMRISRDVTAPTGGRAVLAATILDRRGRLGGDRHAPASAVSSSDLPMILGIFESAYAATAPVAPVERTLLQVDPREWPDVGDMQAALRGFEDQNERRRAAIREWFAAEPRCLRFVLLAGEGGRHRIGATCVLPLTARAFQDYRAGARHEFDLTAADLETARAGEGSSWLCFQSFAVATAGSARAHAALRETIERHVLDLAGAGRRPRVIAEVGTDAGLVEVRHFGMTYCGQSASGRPLFHIDLGTDRASAGVPVVRPV